jgi:predicted small secreted protein
LKLNMKTAFLLALALVCLSFGTACRTTKHAVEDTEDLGEHAVEKTSHAVHHGVEKAENL